MSVFTSQQKDLAGQSFCKHRFHLKAEIIESELDGWCQCWSTCFSLQFVVCSSHKVWRKRIVKACWVSQMLVWIFQSRTLCRKDECHGYCSTDKWQIWEEFPPVNLQPRGTYQRFFMLHKHQQDPVAQGPACCFVLFFCRLPLSFYRA